jgi:putative chitinase
MITLQQFTAFGGPSNQALVDAINSAMEARSINTARRIRYFLTQAYHESRAFTRFEEDLVYKTPERIVQMWPKRFALVSTPGRLLASDYVRQPQKLANLVYAGRFGNGDGASGDGWTFRGRGLFGLTFKDNYREYSKDTYGDERIVQNPDLVSTLRDGVLSAAWFWDDQGLNALADKDLFTKVTIEIQGSADTVPERLVVLNNKANKIF